MLLRRRITVHRFIVVIAVLAFTNLAARAADSTHRERAAQSAGFAYWMSDTSGRPMSFTMPSSPDNWLGGTGNWSNGAGWSAGEPGGSSDVFINTGNDNVTLDVNASINSLTLGGASGTSTLTGSSTSSLTIAGALTINQTGTLTLSSVSAGGTLTNQGVVNASVLNVGGDLINEATGTIDGSTSGSTINVTGELVNHGTIDLRYGTAEFGSLNNPAGGVIRFGADTVQGNISSDGNLLVISLGGTEPPASLTVGGFLETSGLMNVAGTGSVAASVTVAGNITNTSSGIIEVDTLSRFTGASITNSGVFRTGVQGAGGNTVQAGTLNNLAGGTFLLGGVGDIGQFGYVDNAGSISIANGATLNIVAAHAGANASPGFLNSGVVQIDSGGTLFSVRTYTQTGGQTTIDGLLHVSGNGLVNFAGGFVYGNDGTIQGNTVSNAAFNLGDMPDAIGMMAIKGNYTQGANGSITFDIASLTQYDQLNVTGRAQLNGLMTVNLLNGYIPQVGNMFDIMNFASESGTFSTVVGLPINNQEHFTLEYNATNLMLDVVSGPSMQASSGHGSSLGNSSGSEPFITPLGDNMSFVSSVDSAPASSVPEPGSILLFGSGVAGIAAFVRRASSGRG